MADSLPLNTLHHHKSSIIINRSHMLIHSIAIAFLIYYRVSNILFQQNLPTLPWILIFVSELLLSFQWFLNQAHRWRPVSTKVYPERLPEDENMLPDIDVFICTVDPEREPTVGVMNTVISAMALDYPPEKLHVYLSDDGGFPVTLYGMKEAWRFAKWWLPFCKRYGIKISCPDAYLSESTQEDTITSPHEFLKDKNKIKEKYAIFKQNISQFVGDENSNSSSDHPTIIEIVQESSIDTTLQERIKMPLLVYVAREKRPSRPHNFKAGALNVLLRVSGVMSNSPYILGLDCDMYCNDPTSAKQAMCFHLDQKLSPSLAFVQFPQLFHNLNSENDIYGSSLRSFWVSLNGMNGLEGPYLCGTNYYMKRESLYGSVPHQGLNLSNLETSFGLSNEFINTLRGDNKPNTKDRYALKASLNETKVLALASCTFEDDTNWGKKVGFRYFSVVEDYFTGFNLHCKGWKSIFLDPSTPSFLGSATTTLNDVLIQGTRWGSGLGDITLSRFYPFIYGPSKTSFLESMCYAEVASFNLFHSLSVICLALISSICLFNGIPLYPKVSSLYFKVFSFVFVSSLSKHLYEVLDDKSSILAWRNEARIWMMKSCTSYLYGSLDAIMKKLKLREASFVATSKVDDTEQIKLYKNGMFDFQTSTVLLTPLVTLVILNAVAFVRGVVRAMFVGNLDKMLIQVVLSFYVLVMSYVVIEGMFIRNDKAKISHSVTMLSSLLALLVLCLGSILAI